MLESTCPRVAARPFAGPEVSARACGTTTAGVLVGEPSPPARRHPVSSEPSPTRRPIRSETGKDPCKRAFGNRRERWSFLIASRARPAQDAERE